MSGQNWMAVFFDCGLSNSPGPAKTRKTRPACGALRVLFHHLLGLAQPGPHRGHFRLGVCHVRFRVAQLQVV